MKNFHLFSSPIQSTENFSCEDREAADRIGNGRNKVTRALEKCFTVWMLSGFSEAVVCAIVHKPMSRCRALFFVLMCLGRFLLTARAEENFVAQLGATGIASNQWTWITGSVSG